MPRKSTQIMTKTPGSNRHSDMPRSPDDVRPGASIIPEIVNVFQQAVSPGAAPGLRLAPLAGRAGGEAIAVSVQAWVNNLAYAKDVFLDLYLLAADAAVTYHEMLPLLYQEPAGGGGDFFAAGAAVPAPGGPGGAFALRFRLYAHMNGQLYTDGLLHNHVMTETPAAPGPAGTPAKAHVPAREEGRATPTKASTASVKGGTPAPPPPVIAPAAAKARRPTAAKSPVPTKSGETAKPTKPKAAGKP